MNTEKQPTLRHVEWPDLMHAARQVRKVRTNPGSYDMQELREMDMPDVGEFVD